MPQLLFYGPPGTGKTSTIMACARELYGQNTNCMVLELNASEERGIEIVRKRIKSFVMTKNLSFNRNGANNLFKLVILDEIDAMTPDAQAILKKLVETYALNVRFCLICNYIQKINDPLQSRCITFRFCPLRKKNIIPRIEEIAKAENISITNGAINVIIRRSGGDMRKILNQMQSVSMAYDKINEHNVNVFFGYPSIETITLVMNEIIKKDFATAYKSITQIKRNEGLTIGEVVSEIYEQLEPILLKKTTTTAASVFNQSQAILLISKLKLIEQNQNISTNENIQTAALVSAVKLALAHK
jgi:replication factor C subunit 3/5